MLIWALALALGCALALATYARSGARPRAMLTLRALGATLVVALLLNAPIGPTRRLAPRVALDASASWAASADSTAWTAARSAADSALAAGGDSLVVFGSALRSSALLPARPEDPASRIGPLVEQARASGRPVVIVTDGKIDDAERIGELPVGSYVVLPRSMAGADLGVAPLEAPAAVLIGDTVELRILIKAAGVVDAAPRSLTLTLGGRTLATASVRALDPFGERELRLRVAVPALEGEQALVAALSGTDYLAANDTARSSISVVGSASVALISTSPDQDARFALSLLRQTQRGAVRGYWRVAPGQWREGDALRPVTEDAVRRALGSASLVLLHGDTALFGPARQRARGGLVLMPTPEASDEYYATGAGDSPLRAALADLPWDALPPLRVGAAPRGGLSALLARRARRTDERGIVTLVDGTPRTVVVTAAGFWRWRTRAGRVSESFDALWGSIFDWVATTDAPTRAQRGAQGVAQSVANELVPRAPTVRAGPVGSGAARDLTPRARSAWWLALVALLAFSAEWMMRRRIGWR